MSRIAIRETTVYAAWLERLRDMNARTRIMVRIDRLARGNADDVRPVGGGVSELRIDYGPGYRVYFVRCGQLLILLLCGGDKRTQKEDIRRALAMAEEAKD